ncbi:hypothetical protein M438DRAFT_158454 [Aureobasidium pullulans EXF-150]|uniref:Uncharacterized protein n=1 Tax=Aureobasidium pullulans EXF-150 TaxID=1043002 RepID=A0A074XMY7_AURPU|nr:uncharacterized protein M438DRAFT_158454 [Aureobasidium pullulans EXF-150]KEQ86885.1 hypothetical protein M438DRAFT_158454 [Aureobasidium pullulans EXF-150]
MRMESLLRLHDRSQELRSLSEQFRRMLIEPVFCVVLSTSQRSRLLIRRMKQGQHSSKSRLCAVRNTNLGPRGTFFVLFSFFCGGRGVSHALGSRWHQHPIK